MLGIHNFGGNTLLNQFKVTASPFSCKKLRKYGRIKSDIVVRYDTASNYQILPVETYGILHMRKSSAGTWNFDLSGWETMQQYLRIKVEYYCSFLKLFLFSKFHRELPLLHLCAV